MRRVVLVAAFTWAALFGLSRGAAAQEGASIIGLVQDTSGAVLPGVTVDATSDALIERVPVGRHRRRGTFRDHQPAAGHLHRHLHTARLPNRSPRRHRPAGQLRRDGERQPRCRRARRDDHRLGGVAGRRPAEHPESIRGEQGSPRGAAGDALDAGRREPRARRQLLQPGLREQHVGARLGDVRSAHLLRRHAHRPEPHRHRQPGERHRRQRFRAGRARVRRGIPVAPRPRSAACGWIRFPRKAGTGSPAGIDTSSRAPACRTKTSPTTCGSTSAKATSCARRGTTTWRSAARSSRTASGSSPRSASSRTTATSRIRRFPGPADARCACRTAIASIATAASRRTDSCG